MMMVSGITLVGCSGDGFLKFKTLVLSSLNYSSSVKSNLFTVVS